MTDFVYTDTFSTEGTSSVIDQVYYNSDTKELVVRLLSDRYWDGVLAGYENVSPHFYEALELTNKEKLDGRNASVGRYWNLFIKPNFTGFDTGDIEEFIHVDEVDDVEAQADSLLSGFYAQAFGTADVETKEPAKEVPTIKKRAYAVHWDEGDAEACIIINASNEDEAVEIWHKIADLAGWTAAPVSLHRYLD